MTLDQKSFNMWTLLCVGFIYKHTKLISINGWTEFFFGCFGFWFDDKKWMPELTGKYSMAEKKKTWITDYSNITLDESFKTT